MRASDIVDPGQLAVVNGNPLRRDLAQQSADSELSARAGVPGVYYKACTAAGNGTLPIDGFPAELMREYSLSDLAPYLGSENVRFIKRLRQIIAEQLGRQPFWSPAWSARCASILEAGVLTLPVPKEAIQQRNARHTAVLLEPEFTGTTESKDAQRAAWVAGGAGVLAAWRLYDKGNLAAAAELAESANWWADVAAAVEERVAAVAAVGDAITGTASGLFSFLFAGKGLVLIIGLAALAAFALLPYFRAARAAVTPEPSKG
jgi:hypothetical protein